MPTSGLQQEMSNKVVYYGECLFWELRPDFAVVDGRTHFALKRVQRIAP
jgi:hypothetical protein